MKIKTSSGSKIVINGKTYIGSRDISIVNGKVVVDGEYQDNDIGSVVNVTVHGDVDYLENSMGNIECNNAGNIKTVSGDVNCGDVSGSVSTVSGDVKGKKILGNVNTVSGNIIS